MHKICAREVKTTGMETAGNQWGGTNFRKRFINFKKMLAISKKLCEKDTCPVPFWYRAGVLLLPSDLSKNPRSVLLMVINKTLRYTRIFVPLVSRFASLIFAVREISLS